MDTDFGCLILASGQGKRFGMEKLFFSWRGKYLWQYSYVTAKDITAEVVVVGLDIEGGETRQESVKSGLRLIDAPKVVIIEAFRPLVTAEQILRLTKVKGSSVTYGATLDTPICYQNGKGVAFAPPQTSRVILNPQCFDTKLLKEAHAKTSLRGVEDDTTLMKNVHNIDPIILDGQINLYKLVHREDIDILDALSHRDW